VRGEVVERHGQLLLAALGAQADHFVDRDLPSVAILAQRNRTFDLMAGGAELQGLFAAGSFEQPRFEQARSERSQEAGAAAPAGADIDASGFNVLTENRTNKEFHRKSPHNGRGGAPDAFLGGERVVPGARFSAGKGEDDAVDDGRQRRDLLKAGAKIACSTRGVLPHICNGPSGQSKTLAENSSEINV